jgi:prolycopene isomerase
MTTGNYDVVIIGSGIAGLAAGSLLTNEGKKVVVLEQHYEVGGCASMFRRRNFHYDVAVHLISGCEPGGEIYNLLEKLNILDSIAFTEVNPMYHLKLGETTYEVPSNLDELNKRMGNWFPEDKQKIDETIQEIKLIGEAFMKETFQNDAKIFKRVVDLKDVSFGEYVANRFTNPRTAMVLSALNVYAGVNLKKLPTIFMMTVLMCYHNGAFYPKGGSQKLSHVLRDYIRSQGNDVLIKRRVEKILYDGSKVQGVVDHKGNEYLAPIVISNGDFLKTMRDLVGEKHLPPLYKQSMKKMILSNSAIILYAALKNEGITSSLPHELIINPLSDLMGDEHYLYRPTDPMTDPCMSICCPSAIDSSLAPEGYSVISATVYCDPNDVKDLDKKFIEERFLAFLEEKVPGLREQIVSYELATPSTIERFTMSTQGAAYGWEKSIDQPWMGRMGPNTPIHGLYLTGQWTPHIHGVYGACLSGRRTTEVILNEYF